MTGKGAPGDDVKKKYLGLTAEAWGVIAAVATVLALVIALVTFFRGDGSSAPGHSDSSGTSDGPSAAQPSGAQSGPIPSSASTPGSQSSSAPANGISYTFNLTQGYGTPLGLTKPTLSMITAGGGDDIYYNGHVSADSPNIMLALPGDPTPTYQNCADGNTNIEDSANASQGTTFCIQENGKIAGVTINSINTNASGDYYMNLSVTIWEDVQAPVSAPEVQGDLPNGMKLNSYTFNLTQGYGTPLGLTKPTLSMITAGGGDDIYYNGHVSADSPNIMLALPGDPTPTYQNCADGNTNIEDSANASQGTTFCIKENGKIAGVTINSISTFPSGNYYMNLSVTIWKHQLS